MKKYFGYLLGGLMAFAIATPVLFGGSLVHAQALSGADDFFGGSDASTFAATAGLGSGDLADTIASIIRVALGFLGVVAVVIILYGGFRWMIAGGDSKKVDDARKLIFAGITGLIIILSAYAIASFVIDQISTAVSGTTSTE
ncbi:TPA: hypothetical protein DEP34_04380 [Candidatus Uhrbacteria bacterium]|nr:hypothetical protein [Candidatus Uhrbacteria bacterium]